MTDKIEKRRPKKRRPKRPKSPPKSPPKTQFISWAIVICFVLILFLLSLISQRQQKPETVIIPTPTPIPMPTIPVFFDVDGNAHEKIKIREGVYGLEDGIHLGYDQNGQPIYSAESKPLTEDEMDEMDKNLDFVE